MRIGLNRLEFFSPFMELCPEHPEANISNIVFSKSHYRPVQTSSFEPLSTSRESV